MNLIYRIHRNDQKQSIGVGYLLNEDQTHYQLRLQNGPHSTDKSYSKVDYRIESIYEENGESRYQIKTKNSKGKAITIDLSEPCYGGCG